MVIKGVKAKLQCWEMWMLRDEFELLWFSLSPNELFSFSTVN